MRIFAQVENIGTVTIDPYRLEGVFTVIAPSGGGIDAGTDWNTGYLDPGEIDLLEGSWTVPSTAEVGWYDIRVVITSKDTGLQRSTQKDNAFEIPVPNVHLRSQAYDGVTNVGKVDIVGVGAFDLPADIYLENGQYLIVGSGEISEGKKYDFDKWDSPSGGLAISSFSRPDVTLTKTGEGTLTLVLFLWDFTLDVIPTSRTVKQGDGATYEVTVTATGGWTTNTGFQVGVDVDILDLPAGTTRNFAGYFQLSQSNPTDTHMCTIYTSSDTTVKTQPGYTITFKGAIISTTTVNSQTVELNVEPEPVVQPDLIIEDLWWLPSNPQSGDEVTFTYIEKNQDVGDAPAHRNTLLIDGYPISNDVVEALAAGASRTRTFSDTWVMTAGAHEAMVKADDQSAVTESNEENNIRIEPIGEKEQVSTSLTINLNPSSIQPNTKRSIVISGRLTRVDTGTGIAERPIGLEWTGGMTTTTTNADGYYAYTTDVGPYSEGSYTSTAKFDGYETPSAKFLSSTASTTLSVGISKIATSITISLNPNIIQEKIFTTITLSGRLTRTDTGAGLPSKTLSLTWLGSSASIITDPNGYYSYQIQVNYDQGSYIFKASFVGDSEFMSSIVEEILVVIPKTETSLVISSVKWPTTNIAGLDVVGTVTNLNNPFKGPPEDPLYKDAIDYMHNVWATGDVKFWPKDFGTISVTITVENTGDLEAKDVNVDVSVAGSVWFSNAFLGMDFDPNDPARVGGFIFPKRYPFDYVLSDMKAPFSIAPHSKKTLELSIPVKYATVVTLFLSLIPGAVTPWCYISLDGDFFVTITVSGSNTDAAYTSGPQGGLHGSDFQTWSNKALDLTLSTIVSTFIAWKFFPRLSDAPKSLTDFIAKFSLKIIISQVSKLIVQGAIEIVKWTVGTVSRLIAILRWRGSLLRLTAISPSNQEFAGLIVNETSIIDVGYPELGEWTFKIYGESVPELGEEYSLAMSSVELMSNLQIYVTDPGGEPINETIVVSTSQPNGQMPLSGIADSNGYIVFTYLTAGTYNLQLRRDGYCVANAIENVTAGQTTTDIIMLKPIDIVPPLLSVALSPANPQTTQTITFTTTVNDDPNGVGIANASLYIDNFLVQIWTQSGTHTFVGGPYSEGQHTFYVEAFDNAGNVGRDPQSGGKSFMVSPTPTTFLWEWLVIVLIVAVAIAGIVWGIRRKKHYAKDQPRTLHPVFHFSTFSC